MSASFLKLVLTLIKNEEITPHLLSEIDKIETLPKGVKIEELESLVKSFFNIAKTKKNKECVSLSYILLMSKFSNYTNFKKILNTKIVKASNFSFKEFDKLWVANTNLYFEDIKTDARLELIRSFVDTNYNPNLDILSTYKDYSQKEQKYFNILINEVAERKLQNKDKKTAKYLLEFLDDSYEKYWNLHLIDTADNTYIEYLLAYVKNDILSFELQLKYFENLIENESNWDLVDLSEEIYMELTKELKTAVSDDILSKKYVEKLYTKALYIPVQKLFKNIPNKLNTGDKIAIHKSFKRIFEFLKDQNIKIKNTTKMLTIVDIFLFKELKDEESAISFFINALATGNIEALTNNLYKLSLLIRENSVGSDMILETFISTASKLKINDTTKKLIKDLKSLSNPYFKVSGYILDGFMNTDTLLKIPNLISKNKIVFNQYPQLFYVYLIEVFSAKIKTQDLKRFVSTLILSDIEYSLMEQVFYSLLKYFYEQPYIDFISQFKNYALPKDAKNRVMQFVDKFIMSLLGDENLSEDFVEAMPKFVEFTDTLIGKNYEESRSI